MRFDNPVWLLLLLAIPVLLGLQWLARERGRRYAVRFTGVSTLAQLAAEVPLWRRWLPTALALAAVALLVGTLAKPSKAVKVPVRSASIVLVTDHSGSMAADDVKPTRLQAAEKAANAFIDQLPKQAKVGVVAFSDRPDVVEAPSLDHDRARSAIGSQFAEGATATGDALQAAITMLKQSKVHVPSAIVLLSDGATTSGSDPVVAAQAAKRDNIAIDTVALGKPGATIPTPAGNVDVSPDPELLHRISDASGGRAFTASDDERLSSIYKSLGSQLGTETHHHNISSGFAIAGLALLLAAGLSTLALGGRLP